MWTALDLRFLRKLRITADDYPLPLPRFSVEITMDGHVGVYDTRTRRLWLFLPANFDHPHDAAVEWAEQMNAHDASEREKEQQ